MKSKVFNRLVTRAVTVFVLTTFVVSGSMVTLAAGKPVGEITISGSSLEDGQSVTVNGEPAKTGRTIFGSSTISTPAGMSAVISLGQAGKLQLAPGSTFVVNVNDDAISGDLTAGTLSVVNAAKAVQVKTTSGETVNVNAGEVVTATSTAAAKRAQTGPGGLDWWVWAAIIGGAVTAIVLIVSSDDDDDNVTSPVR
jgi:hypothetical protein